MRSDDDVHSYDFWKYGKIENPFRRKKTVKAGKKIKGRHTIFGTNMVYFLKIK